MFNSVGKSRHFCLKKFGRGHDIPLGYLTNNFENLLGLATSMAVQENNKKKSFFLFCACFYSEMKRKMKKPFQKNGFTKYPTLYYSSCLVKIKVIRFYSYKYLFQILFRPKADCTFDNYLE